MRAFLTLVCVCVLASFPATLNCHVILIEGSSVVDAIAFPWGPNTYPLATSWPYKKSMCCKTLPYTAHSLSQSLRLGVKT